MPIFAQALTCRRGYQQITQVAVTRALTQEEAEVDGLAAVIANFPVVDGYAGHACACTQVSESYIMQEATKIFAAYSSAPRKAKE